MTIREKIDRFFGVKPRNEYDDLVEDLDIYFKNKADIERMQLENTLIKDRAVLYAEETYKKIGTGVWNNQTFSFGQSKFKLRYVNSHEITLLENSNIELLATDYPKVVNKKINIAHLRREFSTPADQATLAATYGVRIEKSSPIYYLENHE